MHARQLSGTPRLCASRDVSHHQDSVLHILSDLVAIGLVSLRLVLLVFRLVFLLCVLGLHRKTVDSQRCLNRTSQGQHRTTTAQMLNSCGNHLVLRLVILFVLLLLRTRS